MKSINKVTKLLGTTLLAAAACMAVASTSSAEGQNFLLPEEPILIRPPIIRDPRPPVFSSAQEAMDKMTEAARQAAADIVKHPVFGALDGVALNEASAKMFDK